MQAASQQHRWYIRQEGTDPSPAQTSALNWLPVLAATFESSESDKAADWHPQRASTHLSHTRSTDTCEQMLQVQANSGHPPYALHMQT